MFRCAKVFVFELALKQKLFFLLTYVYMLIVVMYQFITVHYISTYMGDFIK